MFNEAYKLDHAYSLLNPSAIVNTTNQNYEKNFSLECFVAKSDYCQFSFSIIINKKHSMTNNQQENIA